MKYRKKPVVIEAVRYGHDLLDVPRDRNDPGWIAEAFESGVLHYLWPEPPALESELFVQTLEGELKVSIGDYIIRGVKGEIYPCKADVFNSTYEPVDDAQRERIIAPITINITCDSGKAIEDIQRSLSQVLKGTATTY